MATTQGHTTVCPIFHAAIELIGKRWTGAILRAMHAGETRFSDIVAAVPGLSDRLLSERLKELESQGVVLRQVVPETPVRISYTLTEMGRDLDEVMTAITEWSHRWITVAPKACSSTSESDVCPGKPATSTPSPQG
ncbi:MAG: winged helix-turn-helix transcriptional regulator [Thermomicrobiales bacterium]